MKKSLLHLFVEILSLSFIFLLFFCSEKCILLASNGLLIWFQKMIPSLLPFMILSGFMIRSGLSYRLGKLLQPFLGRLFQIPVQMLYVIFMGFLCGFPMGAKIIADMLEKEQIMPEDGQFLLAFCNNIGPLYLVGYVMPLFGWKDIGKLMILMYAVPFGYGLFLRYFSSYRQQRIPFVTFNDCGKKQGRFLSFSHGRIRGSSSRTLPSSGKKRNGAAAQPIPANAEYASILAQSLTGAVEQITLLGGCMILFNCLQIFPLLLEKYSIHFPGNFMQKTFFKGILCSLMEIGGGLSCFAADENALLVSKYPLFMPLCTALLTLGGLSCIFQTYLILKNTELSINIYLRDKVIQAFLILFIFGFLSF